jgi:hypothetical protein
VVKMSIYRSLENVTSYALTESLLSVKSRHAAIAISQLRKIIVLYCARPATTGATLNVLRFHQPSMYR